MSDLPEKPVNPSIPKVPLSTTALLPPSGAEAPPTPPEDERAAVPTAILPPDGAPAVSPTAVLPPAPRWSWLARVRERTLAARSAPKPSPPGSAQAQVSPGRSRVTPLAPPAVVRSRKADLQPSASQIVSMPVVLISAAIVLAVAATILMARQDSKRPVSKRPVPAAEVQGRRGSPGPQPATMVEVPDTEAAPSIEGARNTAANPMPTAESASDELGVGGSAEYTEQGRSGGYARRRW